MEADFNKTAKQYDITADRQKITEQLVYSEEIDALVSTIEVYRFETILSFGAEATEEISKASDTVLNNMNVSQLDRSSEILHTLAKIMETFAAQEEKENAGLFGKLFGNPKKQLDRTLEKYHTIGEEVDKIYIQLKQYESELKQFNRKLNQLFEANLAAYHKLIRYILAGEQGCQELEEYIAKRKSDMEKSGDSSIQFDLTSLNQAQLLLERRIQDLRMAENVALQAIPMIQTIIFGNFELIQKINSAFLITLPVFKQALVQAIMLKRQRVQAEAISILNAKTSEVLAKNANNTAKPLKITANPDSLETTWKTIVTGIEETRQIQEDARKKRMEDQAKLEKIKSQFYQSYQGSNPNSDKSIKI